MSEDRAWKKKAWKKIETVINEIEGHVETKDAWIAFDGILNGLGTVLVSPDAHKMATVLGYTIASYAEVHYALLMGYISSEEAATGKAMLLRALHAIADGADGEEPSEEQKPPFVPFGRPIIKSG